MFFGHYNQRNNQNTATEYISLFISIYASSTVSKKSSVRCYHTKGLVSSDTLKALHSNQSATCERVDQHAIKHSLEFYKRDKKE